MQHLLPRDDTSHKSLSASERHFLRTCALGIRGAGATGTRHDARRPPLRLDGRPPSAPRPIRLHFSRSHNLSECTVQFGRETRAASSVRAELIPPGSGDRPNDGQVKFAVEVGAMGCMGYDVGGGGTASNIHDGNVDGGDGGGGGNASNNPHQRLKANKILRLLERTLLIGGSIDAEALCVKSGEWVWRLHVEVALLDDGGNAVDSCALAAVAALRHFRLPEVRLGGEDGDADGVAVETTAIIHSDDREPSPLPLHHTPLTATFALFSDESGETAAVASLLDPSDREELACNGLLTWSYNKYGEMCCLDFAGGCELKARQLRMAARLGKKRCVEVCEMLEVALVEAEEKAERERMERLKMANSGKNVVRDDLGGKLPFGEEFPDNDIGANGDADDADMANASTDATARNEDEKYRLLALDYASGHIAASVKEDKDTKMKAASSKGKNLRGETSSLFNAILRSAQSTSLVEESARMNRREGAQQPQPVGGIHQNDGQKNTNNSITAKEDEVVEIILSRISKTPKSDPLHTPTQQRDESSVEATETSIPHKPKKKSASASVAFDSDDEEETVVQLKSEFSEVVIRDETSGAASAKTMTTTTTTKTAESTSASSPMDVESSTAIPYDKTGNSATDPPSTAAKSIVKEKSSKPNEEKVFKTTESMEVVRGSAVKTEVDDIDDLAMALKKKKKKKSTKRGK
ncbi:hypothetical protein ACHAXS_005349 [Conticribra weissflogii]